MISANVHSFGRSSKTVYIVGVCGSRATLAFEKKNPERSG